MSQQKSQSQCKLGVEEYGREYYVLGRGWEMGDGTLVSKHLAREWNDSITHNDERLDQNMKYTMTRDK